MLKLGDALMEAVVDTAAEVTIISNEVYATLDPKPPVLRESMMHAAGRGMMVKTFVVGPVDLEIGSKSYATEVYVAPIKDDMLLGLNFMVTYGVLVDRKEHTFNIGG
jgi:predicted aspartyl protease